MSKRFTETAKWDDPWFCDLSERERLFWTYLCDKCDHAGIWKVNWMVAEVYFPGIRAELDLARFSGRIRPLNDEKWFLPKFIQFQYGDLNPDNRAHASVLAILAKEGAYKGLTRPSLGPKDKDKDKEQVKDKDVRGGVGEIPKAAPRREADKFNFDLIWARYPRKEGRKESEKHFKASVKTVQDWLDIQNALENYVKQLRQNHTELQYTKMGSTWFNNWRDYVDYNVNGSQIVKAPPAPPKPKIVEKEIELTEQDLHDMHDAKVTAFGKCTTKDCQYCREAAAVVHKALKTAGAGKTMPKPEVASVR